MSNPTYESWRGHNLIDREGRKVGKIDDIYANDATGQPEWLTVDTGLFGTKSSFVPLRGAHQEGEDLQVPYTKDQIKDAASVDPDGHITPEEVEGLYRHYSLAFDDASRNTAPRGSGDGDAGRAGMAAGTAGMGEARMGDREGRDASRDDAMTRSEEELHVGTESVETGRARLRKYVVTENVQTTVPVQHEEVRVEREPITDANRDAAYRGPEIAEGEHEVTLHEERPVVSKETVAKERVRLEADVVQDEEVVSGEVRKERIELDGEGAEGVEGERFGER